MSLLPDLFYSGWLIDVWNCHGVLKHCSWPVGRGCIPEVEDVRFVSTPSGLFFVPLPVDAPEPTSKQLLDVEDLLLQEIQRHGGINISGFYQVSIDTATKLDDILFPEPEEPSDELEDEDEEELEEVEEDVRF